MRRRGHRKGGEEAGNQKASHLGTTGGPPFHLLPEGKLGFLEKIFSALKASFLEWPRTFLKPSLCSSPRALQHRLYTGISAGTFQPIPQHWMAPF